MARGGSSSRGRGAQGGRRGAQKNRLQRRNGFRSSRLQEVEDTSDRESFTDEEIQAQDEISDSEHVSGSDDDVSTKQSYASLLQVLNANRTNKEPPKKKQKLASLNGDQTVRADPKEVVDGLRQGRPDEVGLDDIEAAMTEAVEEEADVVVNGEDILEMGHPIDSDDEEFVLHDPFEDHYSRVNEMALQKAVSAVKDKKKDVRNTMIGEDLRKTITQFQGRAVHAASVQTIDDLYIKQRLLSGASPVIEELNQEERDVAGEIFQYRDIQFGRRSAANAARLRNLTALHALNHVFKTRDRILKNNMKANQQNDTETIDLRDQGFTRPKVLFIVPTKQSCAKFVNSIAQISEPDQQENKSRFLETFSFEDDQSWLNKPEDFRELFGGNHEEDFRVGLKFTRKTIKYFSGFYNSDIIFSSALGLMRTITTGGGSSKAQEEKKKSHDADFLSSIELVVVDHAAAIQMQNWQHLDYVFSQLNLLPKHSHGCDFSRVRHWYLDGHAKYLRQTVVLSSYHTPEINSLFTQHTSNINGIAKYTPLYVGAMLSLSYSLPITPVQTFLRIDSDKNNTATPDLDSDIRFNCFTTTILPQLLRSSSSSKNSTKGTLILIPSYADFTRLRNYLSTSSTTTSLSFGSISEYTSVRDVARSRTHFMNGRHSVLLYTERAHHHFRYKLKGVRRVFFYGVPENPLFWTELVAMLADGGSVDHRPNQNGHEKETNIGLPSSNSASANSLMSNLKAKGVIRALFSKWDAMKLERIVGTDRVGRLVANTANIRGGDVFEFI